MELRLKTEDWTWLETKDTQLTDLQNRYRIQASVYIQGETIYTDIYTYGDR